MLGLIQLEPHNDDFINRKIKQIFSRYFRSYLQPLGPLVKDIPNPFVTLIQPACTVQPSNEAW